jgi:hypothetical protein
VTAPEDWPLFTTNAGDVTASASGAVSGLADDDDESSSSSDESSVSPDESSVSPDESSTSSSKSASLSDPPAVPFDSSTVAPGAPDPTSHQPVTLAAPPSPVTNLPDSTMDHVDPPTPTLPEVSTDTPYVLPVTTRSSPPPVPKRKRVATGRSPRAHEGLLDSAPSNTVTPSKGVDPPSPPVLADVKDAPDWMKTKGTLDYFRDTFKLGKLSDVIEHWFELERLLGFRKSVSISPFLRAVFNPHEI